MRESEENEDESSENKRKKVKKRRIKKRMELNWADGWYKLENKRRSSSGRPERTRNGKRERENHQERNESQKSSNTSKQHRLEPNGSRPDGMGGVSFIQKACLTSQIEAETRKEQSDRQSRLDHIKY